MAMPTPEFSAYLLDAMIRGGPFSLASDWTVTAHHSFPDFSDPEASEAAAAVYTAFTIPRTGSAWAMTGRTATLDDDVESATAPSISSSDITHLLYWSGAMACFVVELLVPYEVTIGVKLKMLSGNHIMILGGSSLGTLDDAYAATFWAHVWTGSAFAGFPTALDYALASTIPNAATAGAEIVEGGMIRSQVDSTTEFYTRDESDRASNADDFTYAEALDDLPDVDGGDVYVAGTNTRVAFWALSTPRPVLAGSQPRHKLDQLAFLVPVAEDS